MKVIDRSEGIAEQLNCVKKRVASATEDRPVVAERNNRGHETPFSIYIGVRIYTCTETSSTFHNRSPRQHHNLGATTAKDSFYGTGISSVQHPSCDNSGTEGNDYVNVTDENVSERRKVKELPDHYANVQPEKQ